MNLLYSLIRPNLGMFTQNWTTKSTLSNFHSKYPCLFRWFYFGRCWVYRVKYLQSVFATTHTRTQRKPKSKNMFHRDKMANFISKPKLNRISRFFYLRFFENALHFSHEMFSMRCSVLPFFYVIFFLFSVSL